MTTWQRIEPFRTSRRRALTDCEVLTSEGGRGRRIKVKIPPALIEALGWKKGDPIAIDWSQDSNATHLRLQLTLKGCGFRLQHEAKSSTRFLVFSPKHAVEQRRSAQTVRHMVAEGVHLILTVPAWVAVGDPAPALAQPHRKEAA